MSPSTAEETAPLADLSKRANASLRVRSSAIVCVWCGVWVAVLCCGPFSGVCVVLCCVVLAVSHFLISSRLSFHGAREVPFYTFYLVCKTFHPVS